MTEKRLLIVSATNRQHIKQQIDALEVGDQVRVGPPDRLLSQNSRLHAMLGDIARQKKHCNRELSIGQWKILMCSAHSIETGEGADMAPGLTGEYINLREHTSLMSIKRIASLIEYVACWGAENNVKFRETHF